MSIIAVEDARKRCVSQRGLLAGDAARLYSCQPVQFRIIPHSTFAPPPEALDLLWEQLGGYHEDVSFTKTGPEIVAITGEDAPVSMTTDERVEIGRRAVLDIVGDVCEGAAGLRSDWFAVRSEL
jgi:hypothetical protein